MAEKNTLSILETIKKKMNKLDSKNDNGSKIAEVNAEFQYVSSASVAQAPSPNNSNLINNDPEKSANELDTQNAEKSSNKETKNSNGDDFSLDDLDLDDEENFSKISEEKNIIENFEESDLEDYEDEVDFGEEEFMRQNSKKDEEMLQPPITEVKKVMSDLNLFEEEKKEDEDKKDDLDQDDLDLNLDLDFEEDESEEEQIEEKTEGQEVEEEQFERNENDEELEEEVFEEKIEGEDDELEKLEELNLDELEDLSLDEDEKQEDLNLHEEKELEITESKEDSKENKAQDLGPKKDDDEDAFDLELEEELKKLEDQKLQAEAKAKEESLIQEQDIWKDMGDTLGLEDEKPTQVKQEAVILESQMPNSTTPVAASTRNEIDLEFEKQVMGFVSEAPKILQQNLAQDLSPNNQANSEFLRADNFLSQQTQIEQNGVVTMNGAEFAEKSSVIYDSTVRQVNDSVKKLVDAKNVISGISNFSQSPAFSELAINLMEPKLEKWLNQNLPDLVEKIVREEIKKMIPKD